MTLLCLLQLMSSLWIRNSRTHAVVGRGVFSTFQNHDSGRSLPGVKANSLPFVGEPGHLLEKILASAKN